MANATSIFHTGLTVSSLDSAIRFYVEGLGLVLRHRQTQDNEYTCALVGYDHARLHIAQLQFPDQPPPPSGHVIELVEYERPKGGRQLTENCDAGAMHLAFAVDDIHEIARRLEDMGATFLSPPVEITAGINRGGFACYLRDPDGVTLELLQQAPGTAAGAPASAP